MIVSAIEKISNLSPILEMRQTAISAIDYLIQQIAKKHIVQTASSWALDGVVIGTLTGGYLACSIVNDTIKQCKRDPSAGIIVGIVAGLGCISVFYGAVAGGMIGGALGASKAAIFN